MIKHILKKIKENKKYKSIADGVVEKEIKKYLISQKITNIDEITKQDIKNIRAKLHKSYSTFQTNKKNKRNQYLLQLKQNTNDKEINNKLLSITLSTKERINDYKEIYKKIFKITGKPESIVDLGSGLNPLSYPSMDIEQLNYYSYDIDEEDIKFLNQYFEIIKKSNSKFNGKAEILDLRDLEKVSQIPNSDIIFLFKVIDLLDQENHKPSEELIKIIIPKTKYIVTSFATKTITRKKMNYPNRKWFELMLKRNNLNFETINTDNEIFYVIENNY